MGSPVRSNASRLPTAAFNQKINKGVYDAFKDRIKEQGYTLNGVIEPFMLQYANGRFHLNPDDVMKFKDTGADTERFSTTFNRKIYLKFKDACKLKDLPIRYVVTAFMEKYLTGNYVLEYTDVTNKNDWNVESYLDWNMIVNEEKTDGE